MGLHYSMNGFSGDIFFLMGQSSAIFAQVASGEEKSNAWRRRDLDDEEESEREVGVHLVQGWPA